MDLLVAMRVFAGSLSGAPSRRPPMSSISRAPPPAAHVAGLEKHLGVRLLNRTTRRVSLTAEGADFLRRSRRILDERRMRRALARLAIEATGAAAGGRAGRLRTLSAGACVPDFTRRYPDIDLDIRLNDRVVDLVAERVDVALRVGPLRQSGLVARQVGQVNIVTCASPSYLADHGEPNTPDDLREHRLLGLTGRGRVARVVLPRPVLLATPEAALRHAVQLGRGDPRRGHGGPGHTHTADLLVADGVVRGALKMILEDYVFPDRRSRWCIPPPATSRPRYGCFPTSPPT